LAPQINGIQDKSQALSLCYAAISEIKSGSAWLRGISFQLVIRLMRAVRLMSKLAGTIGYRQIYIGN
jgi:hypothetical protein